MNNLGLPVNGLAKSDLFPTQWCAPPLGCKLISPDQHQVCCVPCSSKLCWKLVQQAQVPEPCPYLVLPAFRMF